MVTSKQHFTAAQVADALAKARGIKAAAARALGCDRTTIVNYCKRYPSVQAACDEQREILVDIAEGKLTQEVDQGTEWAVKMVLTTLGKDRGYVGRQEHSGPGGEAIQFEITDARARLRARISELADRRRSGPLPAPPADTEGAA